MTKQQRKKWNALQLESTELNKLIQKMATDNDKLFQCIDNTLERLELTENRIHQGLSRIDENITALESRTT